MYHSRHEGRYVRIETYAKVLFLVFAFFSCASAGVYADARVLSGKMSWWQGVVGSWICAVKIEPIEGGPIQRGVVVAQGSAFPGNVFHSRTVGVGFDFVADQFDGYSVTKKIWWETQADSAGNVRAFRSRNGIIYDQLSATSSLEDDWSKYREIYVLHPDGTLHEEDKRQIAGSWRFYSESTCKRVKPTNPEAGPPST